MRISDRLQQTAASQTVKLDTIAKQLIADGKPVINLTAGELDFDAPDSVVQAATAAVQGSFDHYTSPQGSVELRTGISQYMASYYNLEYPPEQVLVTNGVKQAIFSALQTLVNPGDEVLIPMPGWVSYVEQVKLAGGTPVAVETDASFQLGVEAIEEVATEATVGILLNSPSNPTGTIIPQDTVQQIAALAKEKGWWIISDEIYDRLIYGEDKPVPMARFYPEGTITVNGLSKAGAMTGWRVGFAAGPIEVIKAMTKLQSHLCGNVNNIAQQAALAALGSIDQMVPQYMEKLRERRQIVAEWLDNHSFLSGAVPDGAFYCFINIQSVSNNSELFCQTLLKVANVATVPGVYFGREGFMRISFANDTQLLQQGLDRIDSVVEANPSV